MEIAVQKHGGVGTADRRASPAHARAPLTTLTFTFHLNLFHMKTPRATTRAHRPATFSLQAFRHSGSSLALALCLLTPALCPLTSALRAQQPATTDSRASATAQADESPVITFYNLRKPSLTLPEYSIHGAEMTEFASFMGATYNKFQDALTHYKNGALNNAIVMPYLNARSSATDYDTIKIAGKTGASNDNKSGPMAMSDWNGTRVRSGDEVRGASTMDDAGADADDPDIADAVAAGVFVPPKGSKLANTCVLNMKTNTLVTITTITREGAVISREISEARIAPDKTVYVQTFSASVKPGAPAAAPVDVTVNYYRVNAPQGQFKSIDGKMQTPAIDFTYDTFAGQPDPDIDALAAKTLPAGKQRVIAINNGSTVEETTGAPQPAKSAGAKPDAPAPGQLAIDAHLKLPPPDRPAPFEDPVLNTYLDELDAYYIEYVRLCDEAIRTGSVEKIKALADRKNQILATDGKVLNAHLKTRGLAEKLDDYTQKLSARALEAADYAWSVIYAPKK